jgi:hypothetical protein
MLGFGKKKKQAAQEEEAVSVPTPEPPEKKTGEKDKNPDTAIVEEAPLPAPKKFITKKRIFLLFMGMAVMGAACFLVYTLYLTPKGGENAVYQEMALPHVQLPPEMLRFSFNNFPDLYAALVSFNTQISLFDQEIQRIETIAQRYPEQKKITDTEKKVLEKGKNTLLKVFSKLEKPIKETYVLFQVDETQGLAQITEKKQELTDTAQTALKTAQEQTKKIKNQAPQVPKGIFQGTLYKLKKKFL